MTYRYKAKLAIQNLPKSAYDLAQERDQEYRKQLNEITRKAYGLPSSYTEKQIDDALAHMAAVNATAMNLIR